MSPVFQQRETHRYRISEKRFQEQVLALARLLGWLSYHTHDSRRSQPGFPDLVLCHPRHGVLFRELKRVGGRVKPEQQAWLDALTTAGGDAALWTPSDWNRIESELRGVRKPHVIGVPDD